MCIRRITLLTSNPASARSRAAPRLLIIGPTGNYVTLGSSIIRRSTIAIGGRNTAVWTIRCLNRNDNSGIINRLILGSIFRLKTDPLSILQTEGEDDSSNRNNRPTQRTTP